MTNLDRRTLLRMWWCDNRDTVDISKHFGVEEHIIANLMPKVLRRFRIHVWIEYLNEESDWLMRRS